MLPKPLMAVVLAGALAAGVTGLRHGRAAGVSSAAGEEGRIKGSRSAKLSVIEYFDYQCGACRVAYQLFEEYERAMPGSIRLEMRYYPLPGHPHGLRAAIAAECVSKQGKFWPMHERLMQHQPEWAPLADAAPVFRSYALESGADAAAYDACIGDPQTEIAVLREKEAGLNLGVKLTPTCLINGELVAGSNAVGESLKKALGSVENAHA